MFAIEEIWIGKDAKPENAGGIAVGIGIGHLRRQAAGIGRPGIALPALRNVQPEPVSIRPRRCLHPGLIDQPQARKPIRAREITVVEQFDEVGQPVPVTRQVIPKRVIAAGPHEPGVAALDRSASLLFGDAQLRIAGIGGAPDMAEFAPRNEIRIQDSAAFALDTCPVNVVRIGRRHGRNIDVGMLPKYSQLLLPVNGPHHAGGVHAAPPCFLRIVRVDPGRACLRRLIGHRRIISRVIGRFARTPGDH